MKNLVLLGTVLAFAACSTEVAETPNEEPTSMIEVSEMNQGALPATEVAQAEASVLKKIDLEISGMR